MLIEFKGKLRQIKADCKNYLLYDHRGEYTFSVKGHEIIATFAEKPNNEIFARLREILLGEEKDDKLISSVKHSENNIKEAS